MKKTFLILCFLFISALGFSQEDNKKPEAQRAGSNTQAASGTKNDETKAPELSRGTTTLPDASKNSEVPAGTPQALPFKKKDE